MITRTVKLSYSAKCFPLSAKILRHLAKMSSTQFSPFQLPDVVQKPPRTICSLLTQLVRAGSLLAERGTLSPLRSVRKGKSISPMFSFFFLFVVLLLSAGGCWLFLWLRMLFSKVKDWFSGWKKVSLFLLYTLRIDYTEGVGPKYYHGGRGQEHNWVMSQTAVLNASL